MKTLPKNINENKIPESFYFFIFLPSLDFPNVINNLEKWDRYLDRVQNIYKERGKI